MEIVFDDKTYHVKTMDHVVIETGVFYELKNTSEEPVLVYYTKFDVNNP